MRSQTGEAADVSDRRRCFQADRGRRLNAIVDEPLSMGPYRLRGRPTPCRMVEVRIASSGECSDPAELAHQISQPFLTRRITGQVARQAVQKASGRQ